MKTRILWLDRRPKQWRGLPPMTSGGACNVKGREGIFVYDELRGIFKTEGEQVLQDESGNGQFSFFCDLSFIAGIVNEKGEQVYPLINEGGQIIK